MQSGAKAQCSNGETGHSLSGPSPAGYPSRVSKYTLYHIFGVKSRQFHRRVGFDAYTGLLVKVEFGYTWRMAVTLP